MPPSNLPLALSALPEGATYDVVVIGAGGAGMSAALFAAIEGARVLLVESTEYVGGTTAYSAGTTWIPGTAVGATVNPQDTLANARKFLDGAVGERSSAALREAFLQHGAAAVAQVQQHSRLQYRARPVHPDYLSEVDGSSTCGRALEPLPFDGRLLGDWFSLVRPPIPEFTVLAGMMVDRDDIAHLLKWNQSVASWAYATRIVLRHVVDRLSHPRGTRLLMGNALVGRLLLSLKERQVPLLMRTEVQALKPQADGSTTLTLKQGDSTATIIATGGVVLATGGFNRHAQWRAEKLPGISAAWCAGAPGHTGRLQDMALQLGAHHGPTGQSDCFWAPVSLRTRPDGSNAVFPHFVFDRPKPHMITLDATGRRFLNESTSYHLFGQAMQAANRQRPSIPAWLVTDAQGLRRYGLGQVRPKGMGLKSALTDGYVLQAGSVNELARALKMDEAVLAQTLERFNAQAAAGEDADFQRGTTAYQRANGDATAGHKNPTLGPLNQAPFYALKLYPGDIGAATGLATDEHARLLNTQGQALPGLYAVGNDQHSVMGGVYPGPGITLGPGLVFASLAAKHAVARARARAL